MILSNVILDDNVNCCTCLPAGRDPESVCCHPDPKSLEGGRIPVKRFTEILPPSEALGQNGDQTFARNDNAGLS